MQENLSLDDVVVGGGGGGGEGGVGVIGVTLDYWREET